MKAYLGLRDANAPYAGDNAGGSNRCFGFDDRERNFVRVRVA
jgi:hypothetical protein